MSHTPGTGGGASVDVVRMAGRAADEAAGQTPHELVLGHLDVEHGRATCAPRSASMRSSASAWSRLRGKPSSTKPPRGIGLRDALGEHADRHVVGHERAAVQVAARLEAERLPMRMCSRNMSPVAMCGMPLAAATAAAWVPFPAPGGPNRSTASIRAYFLRTPS